MASPSTLAAFLGIECRLEASLKLLIRWFELSRSPSRCVSAGSVFSSAFTFASRSWLCFIRKLAAFTILEPGAVCTCTSRLMPGETLLWVAGALLWVARTGLLSRFIPVPVSAPRSSLFIASLGSRAEAEGGLDVPSLVAAGVGSTATLGAALVGESAFAAFF